MSWNPNKDDKRYINLIWSMCTDALQSKGVDTKETFISNLRLMCNKWEQDREGQSNNLRAVDAAGDDREGQK